jgi:hypothetical protein
MSKGFVCGITVLAVTGAVLTVAAAPAMAATTTLYVNNTAGANCSDSGTGTLTQPYCTVGAAVAVVTAGQTVNITGTYNENVTIARSGTASQPIALIHQGAGLGRIAGLTIDGQHDISVTGVTVAAATSTPVGISVSNSARITVQQLNVGTVSVAPVVGVQLTAVTSSSLIGVHAFGTTMASGIALDRATTGVLLKSVAVGPTSSAGRASIDVAGSSNTILNSRATGGSVADIVLESGAADNTVANTAAEYNRSGGGIFNLGATGSAISNNTVDRNCNTGIRVDGTSSGVSVQNNVVFDNAANPLNNCPLTTPTDAVEIGLYGAATAGTVVDYNNVFHFAGPGSQTLYAWNSPVGLTGFRILSGQAAHDRESDLVSDNVDSANSAAPGYPSTDVAGHPREDNPLVPDTGAGPISYADRGMWELIPGPQVKLAVTVNNAALSITADASASTPGWLPLVSYTFTFGDGWSVSQPTPVATHTYATRGTYVITVTVTDTASISNTADQTETVWPAARTAGLLAHGDLHYVTAAQSDPLVSDSPQLGPGQQLDLVDLGNGYVALRDRTGLYVMVEFSADKRLVARLTSITDNDTFKLITNADGTVSLQSRATGQYVCDQRGAGPLVADRGAIGDWEKFYLVDPAKTAVSLHAHANGRFVTAEAAGTQPLIANRTAVGLWEQFDLVDLGNGSVALFSHADLRFVTAEWAGTKPLIANRTSAGAWETFKIVKNADGSIALLANADNRYVTAEAAGTQPLIANRSAIGAWEEFDLSR